MKIKEIREAKGIKQSVLAERVKISTGALSYYEKGEREPRYSDLLKIASALGVTVSELLGEEHTTPPVDLGEPVTMLGGVTALPLLNINACAGNGLCACDDDNDVNDVVLLPELYNCEAKTHYCIRVNGESMQPLLDDGDYAIVLKAEYCSCTLRFGQVVLINYCGDNFIRAVHKTSPLTFAPQNLDYPSIVITDEPYTLLGEIVGKVSYKQIISAFK